MTIFDGTIRSANILVKTKKIAKPCKPVCRVFDKIKDQKSRDTAPLRCLTYTNTVLSLSNNYQWITTGSLW